MSETKVKHADEIFKSFKTQSVSEFFKKNAAMLGYTGKLRSLTTLVHEGVTNSLDACEEARIFPDISVYISEVGPEHYRVIMEDNASGIPLDYIPQVFGKMLAGSKAHRNIQSRGQQGIGVSGAVMYSQVTTGKPTEVVTSTGGKFINKVNTKIDVEKNTGEILSHETLKNLEKWRGTRINLEAKNLQYNRSKYGPYSYLKMTAIANPHTRILFVEPDGTKILFDRNVRVIPKNPKEMKPHPHGSSADDILSMIKDSTATRVRTFLVSDFTRVSSKKVEEIEQLSGLDLDINPKKVDWEYAEKLVTAIKQITFMAPPTEGLIPIGAESVKLGLEGILAPEFVHTVTRNPQTYRGGIAFIVEAGIAYGGGAGNNGLDIIRYANRTPLIFDQGGCCITEAAKSIEWKRYGVKDDSAPLTIFVNLVSTHIPYTSAGKQAIATEEEIYNEIRFALMDAGRALSRYLSGKRRASEKLTKKKTLLRYVIETSNALGSLVKAEDNSNIIKALTDIVEKKYDFEEANNGEEATTTASEENDVEEVIENDQ